MQWALVVGAILRRFLGDLWSSIEELVFGATLVMCFCSDLYILHVLGSALSSILI